MGCGEFYQYMPGNSAIVRETLNSMQTSSIDLNLTKVEYFPKLKSKISLFTARILLFQNALMPVGVNGGVLDGIVELLEHCLTQVCFFIPVGC